MTRIQMPLGKKLWEQRGKATGMSAKSKAITEVTIAAETKGFGQFPNGRNTGTMTYMEEPIITRITGRGTLATEDGESLPWNYSGVSKEVGGRSKTRGVLDFDSRSEKYAWTNNLLCSVESTSTEDGSGFMDTGYEWE